MDAAAARGASLPVPSSQPPPRKEWRAVSEHSFQTNSPEETERLKLGESDERTIYEEGVAPLDVDFCSITINNGRLSDDLLQQRIHGVSRQREELQQVEIELRAQAIAYAHVLGMQNRYELQIKEHADMAARLKEQIQEKEKRLHELELKLEEKDRELQEVKMDNEAAWAKEEATFRRERDNSETERNQHLQRIHDLQEHIHEKETQFLALEEQHRVAQETILYKDEQLRETQAWVARVQEMGALQSTTNQSLQAELRERVEQFNQYYIAFQRQFLDMERHHLQVIQQLQIELAEAREHNGAYGEGTQGAHGSLRDSSSLENKGTQNSNDSETSIGSQGVVCNGNLDGVASLISFSNASTKAEHVSGLPVTSPSILGMGGLSSHGQMTPMPHAMQPQAVPQPVSSTTKPVPQPHVGHIQLISTIPAHQHWQNQQVISSVPHMPMENRNQITHTEQNLLILDPRYQYEVPRQAVHPEHVNANINQQQRSNPVLDGACEEVQAFESNGKDCPVSQESQETLTGNTQFHVSLGFSLPIEKAGLKIHENTVSVNNAQDQPLTLGKQWSASEPVVSVVKINPMNSNNTVDRKGNMVRTGEIPSSASETASSLISGKATEPNLLDERSLLACIVRAIPSGSGSGIRISTTLPNRLAKMLAPLQWHDYKKHYGKLDDFVSQHHELFVIEEDFIHLREGAQEIISATTAVAKVAAAASSAPYSTFLPSVAVTPAAQGNRHKKAPSTDLRSGNAVQFIERSAVMSSDYLAGRHLNIFHNQQPNGVSFNIVQGVSKMKILSKAKDAQGSNSLSNEQRPSSPSARAMVGNGAMLDRSGVTYPESRSTGRQVFGGKRSGGPGLNTRR